MKNGAIVRYEAKERKRERDGESAEEGEEFARRESFISTGDECNSVCLFFSSSLSLSLSLALNKVSISEREDVKRWKGLDDATKIQRISTECVSIHVGSTCNDQSAIDPLLQERKDECNVLVETNKSGPS